MRHLLKGVGIFVIAFVMGTMYAVLVSLISSHLRAGFIAWPIWTGIFWLLFWKFRLLRFAGYIAVLPVSVLAFEMVWPTLQPGMVADRYTSMVGPTSLRMSEQKNRKQRTLFRAATGGA